MVLGCSKPFHLVWYPRVHWVGQMLSLFGSALPGVAVVMLYFQRRFEIIECRIIFFFM